MSCSARLFDGCLARFVRNILCEAITNCMLTPMLPTVKKKNPPFSNKAYRPIPRELALHVFDKWTYTSPSISSSSWALGKQAPVYFPPSLHIKSTNRGCQSCIPAHGWQVGSCNARAVHSFWWHSANICMVEDSHLCLFALSQRKQIHRQTGRWALNRAELKALTVSLQIVSDLPVWSMTDGRRKKVYRRNSLCSYQQGSIFNACGCRSYWSPITFLCVSACCTNLGVYWRSQEGAEHCSLDLNCYQRGSTGLWNITGKNNKDKKKKNWLLPLSYFMDIFASRRPYWARARDLDPKQVGRSSQVRSRDTSQKYRKR